MRGLFIAIILLAFLPSEAMAQGVPPFIIAPADGQVLRGQVSVTGTTDVPGFASAELDFAYPSQSTGTWFLIQAFSQPAANSTLATWDTTLISDGDYVLRLRVALQDGTFRDATIKIRIQNAAPLPTAISTATPTPVFIPRLSTLIPPGATSTPTTPPFATPSALPPNPVVVQTDEIYAAVQHAAWIIVGLFVMVGILIRLRRS